jgi:outer membrane protein OmpA-like peptidoglycan-associated protein
MKNKIFLSTVLVLAGCAAPPPPAAPVVEVPRTARIILLPLESPDVSAIIVRSPAGEKLLNTPYAQVDVHGSILTTGQSSANEVKRDYEKLFSGQARSPQLYTLYFVKGTNELTSESAIDFEKARKQIASWPAAEIVVIGHADRTGSTEVNDALSLERAKLVASQLQTAGVSSDVIEVAARGEREPLVQTPKGVEEPRNRRVEIKVR